MLEVEQINGAIKILHFELFENINGFSTEGYQVVQVVLFSNPNIILFWDFTWAQTNMSLICSVLYNCSRNLNKWIKDKSQTSKWYKRTERKCNNTHFENNTTSEWYNFDLKKYNLLLWITELYMHITGSKSVSGIIKVSVASYKVAIQNIAVFSALFPKIHLII